MDRAQEVRAGFALEATTAAAVAQICERLDGIPLAIELAAARVASMQPGDIAARLDERFRLLTGGRRTAVERHHTLRATVDWSYELLSAAEQATFDRLGVFAGGFTLQAAEQVIVGEGVQAAEVVDRVDGLVARSMVALDESAPTTRYELLETMRQYARERLEGDDADVWRRRHAQHYASLAEGCGVGLHGGGELAARAQIHRELDNLRAAVTWSLDSLVPGDVEAALRIIAAIAHEAGGHQQLGVGAWAMRAAPRASASSPGQRTAVLAAAAVFAVQTGDTEHGRQLASDALHGGMPLDCPWPYLAYMALGLADTYDGHPEHAYETLCRIRREVEASGTDPFTMAALTILVTSWATSRGDFSTARPIGARARIGPGDGKPNEHCVGPGDVGMGLHCGRSEEGSRRTGGGRGVGSWGRGHSVYAPALGMAAVIRSRNGDAAGSLRDLREGLKYSHESGLVPTVAGMLWLGIEVFSEVGRPETGAALVGIVCEGAFQDTNFSPLTTGVDRNETLKLIEAKLDGDTYATALARGGRMSSEEAVGYAVSEIERTLTEVQARPPE